jgi:cephalosporin hydroxylase
MGYWNQFKKERRKDIYKMAEEQKIKELGLSFISETAKYKYSYNFSWLGSPIIQFPQDVLILQEIIWETRPDLIIETGIAHGGSLIFYASMLELLGNNGQVLGIDIDIRDHNRREIEKHTMSKRITMIEGSSIDENVFDQVTEFAKDKKSVFVCLDSMHTHDHVLQELELYSPLVTVGSYLVVLDTIIEDMPENSFPDRPWDRGNNPKTAVWAFLKKNTNFEIDKDIENKMIITSAPDGFLKCVK